MVRIQCRVSRRRYLGGKRVYEYERMSLHIPRRFHNKVKPFLKQDLDMQVTTKEDSLIITLTPIKRFGTPKTPPKNRLKKLLGHKKIDSTMKYTQLVHFKDDEFDVATATTIKEAKPLAAAGFEYITEKSGIMLWRRPKRFNV